jgi:autotransporter adhesin
MGNGSNVTGSNNIVLGNNVQVNNVDNAVVLGNNSTAEADAVSVGSSGGERQIKHVAPGTEATDAATIGQLQAAGQNTYNNDVYLNNRINKLDNRVNKIGAGAAALAALHPLDMDGKFGMGLGYGNYRNANAMAMGLFYQPKDNLMFSIGGSMGNGENMVNAGVIFALDKGKGLGASKTAMARKIAAQDAEIAALKEAHQKESAAQDEKIAAQDAEIAALKEALARLEAKVGK